MAKDRRARFQTASELHEALEKIADKIGRGGWLHKGAASVVPLVRAADPVARHKGRRRRPGRVQGETMSTMSEAVSSSENRINRSARLVDGDHGVELQSSSSVNARAVAVESSGKQSLAAQPAMAGIDSSTDAVAKIAEGHAVGRALFLSQSGTEEVEYGFENADLQAVPAWTPSEDDEFGELVKEQAGRARARMRMALAVIAVAVVVAGVLLLVRSGLFRPIVLGLNDRLLLTVIQNKTSDKSLDGAVMQGLEIALRQSKSLDILGGEAYRAGLRQIEAESGNATTTVPWQRVAQKVRARAYLYGEITGTQAPYTISVDVLEADSNDKVVTLEEIAANREEIPTVIGKLAKEVRAEVSEDTKSELRKSVPLEQEASSKVDALHAYALGEAAMRDGRRGDAMMAYQQAAAIDPGFVQAHMRLAWLYRDEKAEVASADAATAARDASVHASTKVKLLANFCYEMNANGDTDEAARTIRDYVARYPLDVDGMKGMGVCSANAGTSSEALKIAQQGSSRDPFDAQTYAEAELAMIGMGRYDGVFQLETEAKRAGIVGSANALTAGYLTGKDDVVASLVDVIQRAVAGESSADGAQVTYTEWVGYGLFLDNTGRLNEGTEFWRITAAKAGAVRQLSGTQAYLLAQAALDRALAESCTPALQMADEVRNLPKGVVASFNAGMAAALCGDEPYVEKTILALQQNFPKSVAVTQYYVPELQAAAEIGVNEAEKSIQTLTDLSRYDEISLTPYLRGMAHTAIGQMEPAILDFQVVLYRGGASVLQGNVYPMALLGEARAYSVGRNKPESIEAYRQFLTLWRNADGKQALMNEALARSK